MKGEISQRLNELKNVLFDKKTEVSEASKNEKLFSIINWFVSNGLEDNMYKIFSDKNIKHMSNKQKEKYIDLINSIVYIIGYRPVFTFDNNLKLTGIPIALPVILTIDMKYLKNFDFVINKSVQEIANKKLIRKIFNLSTNLSNIIIDDKLYPYTDMVWENACKVRQYINNLVCNSFSNYQNYQPLTKVISGKELLKNKQVIFQDNGDNNNHKQMFIVIRFLSAIILTPYNSKDYRKVENGIFEDKYPETDALLEIAEIIKNEIKEKTSTDDINILVYYPVDFTEVPFYGSFINRDIQVNTWIKYVKNIIKNLKRRDLYIQYTFSEIISNQESKLIVNIMGKNNLDTNVPALHLNINTLYDDEEFIYNDLLKNISNRLKLPFQVQINI